MAASRIRPVGPITPHLWFDSEAEAAAQFYVSLFEDSSIDEVTRYPDAGKEVHGREPGSAMTVRFHLNGQPFLALNGGPLFRFNESISFVVTCGTQAELDTLWDQLIEGGDRDAQQCGWLKDRFGVSWQVIPQAIGGYLGDPDPERARRAMEAMLKMKKLDIAELERAAAGEAASAR